MHSHFWQLRPEVGHPHFYGNMESDEEKTVSPWKDRLIPGAEGLALALGVVAAGLFADPSLVQKFCAQLAHRRMVVNLDVA
jgi:hypothetical protein